jgi:hypothetical protein
LNLLINEKGHLNSNGSDKLKAYFNRYQDPTNVNSIMQANIELENIRLNMGNNIKSLVSNMSDLKV